MAMEGIILALLDFLVDPLLPSKSSSSRGAISLSQEQSVAKQVHAVVLLYNYYHRKRYPGLEFLEFKSFCKVAVALKPSLLPYLRTMQKAEITQADDGDQEISLTEKAIMNACDICKSLDASKNSPVIDGWPVNRVAVFLVDDKKENCYLFHSSVTQGVWSAIEKDADVPNQSSEAVTQSRSGDKKKRLIKKPSKENQTVNEASLQQLAYAAVNEACGIDRGDLKTLENHVVYSIGKEKTTVRLYIMQCTLTNQDMNLVPINDALESLQGPLVKKELGSWIATPVVEYFHLLPYVDKVMDWLSREGLLNISINSEVQKEESNCSSPQLYVELPLIPLDHFGEVNGVENHDSHFKEEPLPSISQPVQAAKEVSNGGRQLKEEPLQCSPPRAESAKKVEDNDSSNLIREEQRDNTSAPVPKVLEVTNGSRQLKVEPGQLKDEPVTNSPPRTETAKKAEDNTKVETESTNGRRELKKERPETTNRVEDHKTRHKIEERPQTVEKESTDGCRELKKERPETTNRVEDHKTRDKKEERPQTVEKESTDGCCELKKEHQLYICQSSETTNGVEDHKTCDKKEERPQTVVYTKRKRCQKSNNSSISSGSKKSNATAENSMHGDRNCALTVSSNNTDSDEAVTTCSQADGKSKSLVCQDDDNQKQLILAEEIDQTALTETAIVVAEGDDTLPISYRHDVERVSSDNKISDTAMSSLDEEQGPTPILVSSDTNLEHLHKMQLTIASKERLLSETALKVLLKKRESLSQQLRCVSDDFALCERSIQTILNGDEGNLGVMIDTVIEGCNNASLRSNLQIEDRASLQNTNLNLPAAMKRRRLCEANLHVNSGQCQELDDICKINGWALPTYNVSASLDGFRAGITMKGPDFECSSEGSICAAPNEARNSAASKLLAKLRTMAAQS